MGDTRMISVSNFSRQTSVWRDAAPMLEHVVRWLNTQLTVVGAEVPSTSNPARHSLLSETAFLLASNHYDASAGDPSQFEASARQFVSQLPRSDSSADALSTSEWQEIYALFSNIKSYASEYPTVEYAPKLPGCGVVDACTGDMAVDSLLIEIKAVSRPFRSLDLRQTLTYCALLHSAGKAPASLALLNPRLGVSVEVTLGIVAAGASGVSSIELLENIVQAMTGLQVSA